MARIVLFLSFLFMSVSGFASDMTEAIPTEDAQFWFSPLFDKFWSMIDGVMVNAPSILATIALLHTVSRVLEKVVALTPTNADNQVLAVFNQILGYVQSGVDFVIARRKPEPQVVTASPRRQTTAETKKTASGV